MNVHQPVDRVTKPPFPEQFEFRVELGALRFHLFTDAGFFRTNCDWRILNHNHALYEVQFVHRGTIVLNLDDGCHEVPEGSFCVIPPGLYHSQQQPYAEEEVHKSCFSFRYEVMPRPKLDSPPGESEALLRALQDAPFFIARDRDAAMALLDGIKQELRTQPIGYFAKVQSMFGQVLVDVLRASPAMQTSFRSGPPPAAIADNRLAIIETFFSEHFDQQLKEDDLAGPLYVSHRQLNRILHDLYGMSFRRKLQDTRMKVAMDLLKHSELSVKEIAARVGYPFAENFHAHFKAHANMTPTAFRRAAASQHKSSYPHRV